MTQGVISIRKLSKTYRGGLRALHDINLEIQRGEIFGLLGPNGAGKTTLISIIAGLTRKTSGDALVFGKDVVKDYRFTRSRIGVVQQEINEDPFFTIEETVKFQGGFFGLTNLGARTEEILKSLGLWEKRSVTGRKLSGGMKRRVMIAKALIHDPDILFLDEPTAGVDVEFRAHLWNLIRAFKERGKTIILTTHYLEEAEELADRIAMIYDGEIILLKEKEALIQEFASEKIIFELNKALHTVPKALAKLRPHLKGTRVEVFYAPEFKHSIPVQEVFEAINAAGAKVLRVETERTDLNDIYVKLIRKNHAHKRAIKTS